MSKFWRKADELVFVAAAIGPWAFIVARCHYRGSGKGLHTRQYRNDGQQHKQIKGDNRARAGQGQHGQRVQGGLRDPRPGDGGTIPGDPFAAAYPRGVRTVTYKIYTPDYVMAIPGNNNQFLGWYDKSGKLISTRNYLDDREVDDYRQQHIYASFSGEANPDGAPSQVTIRLSSSTGGTTGGKGKIGFSSGSLSYTSQTKTVKYGEEVTIYAEGDEIVGDYSVTHYYCIGFYLDSGAAIKTFSDTNRLHSYTFTATKDMDISADWKKYDY